MQQKLITAEELATALSCSTSYIRKGTRRDSNPIPHVRFPGSKSVRYNLDQVLEWLGQTDQVA